MSVIEPADDKQSEQLAEAKQQQATNDRSETKLSKNQYKKLARKKKWLESRAERRRIEKVRKKAKKLELDKLGIPSVPKRIKLMSDSSNKFRVVIDMDFEEFMTVQETQKAVKQLGRIYATNRHSENPCQLYITSLKGLIRERMAITNTGYDKWDANMTDKSYLEVFSDNGLNYKEQFVYLSGDSEESLPEVDELLRDESKIFVIGGLVDHNRHKNLCHKRASELQIKTAKLPLKEHIKLSQRHVLSTFAVFEIMLHVLSSRKQWPEALQLAIPKRKIDLEESTTKCDNNETVEESSNL